MLETLSGKTIKAATSSSSSSPFAFVPRQVRLANNNNNMGGSSEVDNKTPNTIKKEKTKKTKKNKNKNKNMDCSSKDPFILLVAAYLQHKGFTTTLAALQSEASIDEVDYSEVHALELETKAAEISKCIANSNNYGLEELDKEGQKESKCAGPVEPSIKKKKRSKESDASTVDKHPVDSKPDSESVDGSSVAIAGNTEETVPETQLDKPDKKSKEKKKRKNKSISVENGGSEACSLEGKAAVDILPDGKNLESNDSKKEQISTLDDNTVDDNKSSKKRKRMPLEGNYIQPDGAGKPTIEISEDMGKKDKLVESDGHTGKRRKVKTGQDDSSKSESSKLQVSVDNKLNILADGEKSPKGNNDQTKADLHDDGYLERSGKGGSTAQKSTKKQQNGSAEPKTVKAFQRVKIDEVKFADDRLQDNSYWAKDGADIGYGAKAQEVLGQVRGRDFRHEKTKKKRGSYRGGQIDLQTHSIKFNYSDEE